MVHHGLTRMERAANFMNCGWQNGGQAAGYPLIGEPSWKSDYTFGPIGGISQLTELDSMLSATFIDTGTKCRGRVLRDVRLALSRVSATSHMVWARADVNGQIAAFTPRGKRIKIGEAAADGIPYWWIYDPLDMARVYKREVKPHEIAPKAAFSGQHMHGAANAPRSVR